MHIPLCSNTQADSSYQVLGHNESIVLFIARLPDEAHRVGNRTSKQCRISVVAANVVTSTLLQCRVPAGYSIQVF